MDFLDDPIRYDSRFLPPSPLKTENRKKCNFDVACGFKGQTLLGVSSIFLSLFSSLSNLQVERHKM